MAARHYSIVVRARTEASASTVFALLKDGATWPHWTMFNAFRLERLGRDEPFGVGAVRVFITSVSKAREEIVELVPNQRLSYVLLSGEVNGRWDWGGRGSGRDNASVDGDLRSLLTLNPSFRLMVAHGYADMVTPYSVSRYVLDHLPDFPNPGRAQLKVYRGGHMFYIDPGSLRDFTADARAFYLTEPALLTP